MATRYYLGIAEQGPKSLSLSFPAFPGTITAGDTWPELMTNAHDALASIVEAMQEDGLELPESFGDASALPAYNHADYENPYIALLSVEVGGKATRINVTMDEGLVARLDRLADRAHSNRSALLAKGARMVLAAELAE